MRTSDPRSTVFIGGSIDGKVLEIDLDIDRYSIDTEVYLPQEKAMSVEHAEYKRMEFPGKDRDGNIIIISAMVEADLSMSEIMELLLDWYSWKYFVA